MDDRAERDLLADILDWDIYNWGRAVGFWDEKAHAIARAKPGFSVLEIGAAGGGISLYWALLGANVLCSEIDGQFDRARALHAKHGVSDRVRYEALDAANVLDKPFPYKNEFDVVTFKSVIGGVGVGDDTLYNQVALFENIYYALKPGGYLFFCENLVGSKLHMKARELLTDHVGSWRYVTIDKVLALADRFDPIEYETFGAVGIFGRTDALSAAFGAVDRQFDRLVKPENRYIISAVCKKPEDA